MGNSGSISSEYDWEKIGTNKWVLILPTQFRCIVTQEENALYSYNVEIAPLINTKGTTWSLRFAQSICEQAIEAFNRDKVASMHVLHDLNEEISTETSILGRHAMLAVSGKENEFHKRCIHLKKLYRSALSHLRAKINLIEDYQQKMKGQ